MAVALVDPSGRHLADCLVVQMIVWMVELLVE
jgi:hypothetical protein